MIIPYFTFASILFFFWLTIGRRFGESLKLKTPIIEAVKGIFIGTQIKGVSSVEWGGMLWFLLSLFLVSNIYYFISKYGVKKIIIFNIILGYCGYYLSKHPIFLFKIWNFDTSLIAINFYTLGNLLKNRILNSEFKFPNYIIILIFLLSFMGSQINDDINMWSNTYSNIILFYITAISGIFFVFMLVKKINIKSKYIKYMGENTIIILACHPRIMSLIKLILIFVVKITLEEYSLFKSIIYSIIQILLCVPIIFIFNKYFPFLIGKRRKKEC